MTKLTTAKIKELMSDWLSTDEMKKMIYEEVESNCSDNPLLGCFNIDKESLEHYAHCWDLPSGLSIDDIKNHVWPLWKDGKQWARDRKERLKDQWNDMCCFIENYEGKEISYAFDYYGKSNQVLIEKLYKDNNKLKDCWIRTFIPKSEWADNFRMDVITTPEDDEVVGWNIIVD